MTRTSSQFELRSWRLEWNENGFASVTWTPPEFTCTTDLSCGLQCPLPLKIQDVGCVSNGLSRDPFQYSPLHQKRAICCPTKCQVCTHILCCRVDITGNWTVSFFRLFSHATNLLLKHDLNIKISRGFISFMSSMLP